MPHLLTALGADVNLSLWVVHRKPMLTLAQGTLEWLLVNHSIGLVVRAKSIAP